MSTTHPLTQNRDVMIERTIHVIECAACSVDFGIGADFMARRRKDHQVFYCPNGHSNYYSGETDIERKARLYANANARAESWKDQAEAAERSRRAQKGVNTRLRKRIANGVCPCCHRSFVELQKHMAGQHPDYIEQDGS